MTNFLLGHDAAFLYLGGIKVVQMDPNATERHSRAIDWLDTKRDSKDIFVSEITLAALLSNAYQPGVGTTKRKAYEKTYEKATELLEHRLQRVHWEVLKAWAEIRFETVEGGEPLPVITGLEVAFCMLRNSTYVAARTPTLEALNLKILDPWHDDWS